MTSLLIILFMFIHNSSSKHDRKTQAGTNKLLTHCFSAGAEYRRIFAILTFSSISPDKFGYEAKLISFKKIVLPAILK